MLDKTKYETNGTGNALAMVHSFDVRSLIINCTAHCLSLAKHSGFAWVVQQLELSSQPNLQPKKKKKKMYHFWGTTFQVMAIY
jgi:hypothetical protein